MKNILILGASDKHSRYSYRALKELQKEGHNTILVSNTHNLIEGIKTYPLMSKVKEKIDAITVYVNPSISMTLKEEFIKSGVKIIIFNPGSENPNLYKSLKNHHVKVIEACTLVLLRTKQFDSIF